MRAVWLAYKTKSTSSFVMFFVSVINERQAEPAEATAAINMLYIPGVQRDFALDMSKVGAAKRARLTHPHAWNVGLYLKANFARRNNVHNALQTCQH